MGGGISKELHAALEAMLDPAVVLEPLHERADDPGAVTDYRTIHLNQAARTMVGIPADAVVDVRLYDLVPHLRHLGGTEPGVLDQLAGAAVATGVRQVARSVPFDLVLRDRRRTGRVDVSVAHLDPLLVVVWRNAGLAHELAVHREALDAERRRIGQLQEAILPRQLASPEGAAIAARYRSADGLGALGGDWYDAIPSAAGSPDGEAVVLCVGDVAGHGMEAVEVMGVARLTARAYASEDARPDHLLTRMARYAENRIGVLSPPTMVTIVVASYEPATRALAWSSAGHPPPLLVDEHGPRLLTAKTGPPLSALSDGYAYAGENLVLTSGASLVLYTDGLIERRGESIDDGFDRLLAAAADLPADPGAACDHLLERCLPPTTADDVCVLVLRVG